MTAYDREFAAGAPSLDDVKPVTAVTPGQAAYETWWRTLGGGGAWEGISRQAQWEAVAQAAIAAQESQPAPACRTCDGSGTLWVPDSDGESASEQSCTDPAHDAPEPPPAPELAELNKRVASLYRLLDEVLSDRMVITGVGGERTERWRQRADSA